MDHHGVDLWLHATAAVSCFAPLRTSSDTPNEHPFRTPKRATVNRPTEQPTLRTGSLGSRCFFMSQEDEALEWALFTEACGRRTEWADNWRITGGLKGRGFRMLKDGIKRKAGSSCDCSSVCTSMQVLLRLALKIMLT